MKTKVVSIPAVFLYVCSLTLRVFVTSIASFVAFCYALVTSSNRENYRIGCYLLICTRTPLFYLKSVPSLAFSATSLIS
jgi:hypothetical protein